MISLHELKTWPEYFNAVEIGLKAFELRKDDRDYKVGDVLLLREWTPRNESFTGLTCRVRVTYVLRDAPEFGLKPGYVVLSIAKGGA